MPPAAQSKTWEDGRSESCRERAATAFSSSSTYFILKTRADKVTKEDLLPAPTALRLWYLI